MLLTVVLMPTPKLWGISNNNLAAFDSALGSPVKAVRDYTTLDAPTPAKWKGLATGRSLVVTSLKWKLRNAIIDVSPIPGGSISSTVKAYGQFLIDNGLDGCFDHEIDAKTAAQGGTPAELDAAFLRCLKDVRSLPGWNRHIYVGLTGYDEVDRGPLFESILDAADGVMIDPYANTLAQSFDAAVGPAVDWLTKNPGTAGKPIILGEFGTPVATGRDAWIAQASQQIQGARYDNVIAACWWNAADPGFDCTITPGTADFNAWIAAAKSLNAPNLQALLDAANAQIAALAAELAAAQGANATLHDAMSAQASKMQQAAKLLSA